jgi:hypothetical protein
VAADVLDKRITADIAHRVYGVVIGDDGEADDDGTAERRDQLRAERRARSRVGDGRWAWHSD